MERIEVKTIKSDKFHRLYATGAKGGHTPFDFRIGFYNEWPADESTSERQIIEREILVEIILAPLAAKQLVNWLDKHVKEYEKHAGVIKIGKEEGEEEKKPDYIR